MSSLTKFSIFGSCGRLLLSTNRLSVEMMQNLLKTKPVYIDCRAFMAECPVTSVIPAEPDKFEFVVAANAAELPPNKTFPQFGGPVIVARKLAYDPLRVMFRKRVAALHERRIRPASRRLRVPPTVGRRLSTVYETFHELQDGPLRQGSLGQGSLAQGVPEIRVSCFDSEVPDSKVESAMLVTDPKVESAMEVEVPDRKTRGDCWHAVPHAKLQYASM